MSAGRRVDLRPWEFLREPKDFQIDTSGKIRFPGQRLIPAKSQQCRLWRQRWGCRCTVVITSYALAALALCDRHSILIRRPLHFRHHGRQYLRARVSECGSVSGHRNFHVGANVSGRPVPREFFNILPSSSLANPLADRTDGPTTILRTVARSVALGPGLMWRPQPSWFRWPPCGFSNGLSSLFRERLSPRAGPDNRSGPTIFARLRS